MKKNIYSIYCAIISVFFLVLAGCGGTGGSLDVGNAGLSSGSITLSWDAPTLNIDGSPIHDLGGYKIYYGQGPANYTVTVDIGNSTSAVLSDLTSGTWCFASTSYDNSGHESSYSNEVCTTV